MVHTKARQTNAFSTFQSFFKGSTRKRSGAEYSLLSAEENGHDHENENIPLIAAGRETSDASAHGDYGTDCIHDGSSDEMTWEAIGALEELPLAPEERKIVETFIRSGRNSSGIADDAEALEIVRVAQAKRAEERRRIKGEEMRVYNEKVRRALIKLEAMPLSDEDKANAAACMFEMRHDPALQERVRQAREELRERRRAEKRSRGRISHDATGQPGKSH